MDLYRSETARNRLFKAMKRSWERLEPFRRLNKALIEEYVGPDYGAEEGLSLRRKQYANLMQQAVDAYTMGLVANRPRVTVETRRETLKFFAKHFTIAINNMLQEICLEKVLRDWVQAAFFSLGIVRVHWADVGEVEFGGQMYDPGTPWASIVGLDDWCHDMSARRPEEFQFAANSYRLPYEDLFAGRYDFDVAKRLEPTSGESGLEERVESLAQGYQDRSDDVEPMIDLMDVWIPREQKIYTFAMDPTGRFQGKGGPLAVMDWVTPEAGPYHLLSFNTVPENVMPSSPASHLVALSSLINNLLRKQARQARRQKEIFPYTEAAAAHGDVQRIQRTDDGEFVKVMDVKEIGHMKSGGVDPTNQAFSISALQLYDRMAGNLPAMLGLGPQAETLGQEQLIHGAASKKEAQMRMRTLDATRSLVRNLAYMLWIDVAKVIPGQMAIPSADGIAIASTWRPEYRMGQFYDYDLDIDIHSMPYQPPSQKAKVLMDVVGKLYLPTAQLWMRQGGQLDFQALNAKLADLLYQPALLDVMKFSAPAPGELPQQLGNEVPAAVPSEHEHTRRNVQMGQTPQAEGQSMQKTLLETMASQGAQPGSPAVGVG